MQVACQKKYPLLGVVGVDVEEWEVGAVVEGGNAHQEVTVIQLYEQYVFEPVSADTPNWHTPPWAQGFGWARGKLTGCESDFTRLVAHLWKPVTPLLQVLLKLLAYAN